MWGKGGLVLHLAVLRLYPWWEPLSMEPDNGELKESRNFNLCRKTSNIILFP